MIIVIPLTFFADTVTTATSIEATPHFFLRFPSIWKASQAIKTLVRYSPSHPTKFSIEFVEPTGSGPEIVRLGPRWPEVQVPKKEKQAKSATMVVQDVLNHSEQAASVSNISARESVGFIVRAWNRDVENLRKACGAGSAHIKSIDLRKSK